MTSRLEQDILLAHVLGCKRIDLIAHPERKLTREEQALFDSYLKRLQDHEPLAHIVNNQPFMSLDFYVDRNVLIPRPETELLVELTIDLVKGTRYEGRATLADIGTGSGCIAVSLAKYLPNVEVVGIDSSPEALQIAQKNAKAHGVDDRCTFILGDILTTKARRHEEFDFIVSNPPYIPTADIATLESNVRDFEPRSALDGGEDGLAHIRKLLAESPNHLPAGRHGLSTNPPNYLLFEFGIGQAEKIKELAKDKFTDIKIIKDRAGIERIFFGQ